MRMAFYDQYGENSFPSGVTKRWKRYTAVSEAERLANQHGWELGDVEPELAAELERVRALSPARIQDEAAHAFHPGREPELDVLRPKTAGELKGRRNFSRWSHYGMRYRVVGNALEKEEGLDQETVDQIRCFPPRKPEESSSPKKEFKEARGFLLFGVETKEEYLQPQKILGASEGKRGSTLTHLSGGMHEDEGEDEDEEGEAIEEEAYDEDYDEEYEEEYDEGDFEQEQAGY